MIRLRLNGKRFLLSTNGMPSIVVNSNIPSVVPNSKYQYIYTTLPNGVNRTHGK